MGTVAQRSMLIRLGLLGALAVVAVLAAVAIGGPGGGSATGGGGTPAPDSALRGIPQSGVVLGSPDAPVTMVEFADLQCPFCAEYHHQVFPELLNRYVRTGKLRLELRLLRFLGPDSDRLARAAAAAAAQNRMWQFAGLAYDRQGRENSGYASDSFIKGLLADAGVRNAHLGAAAERQVRGAEQAARTLGIDATPSFLIGPTGGKLARLQPTELTPGAFIPRIQQELSQ
jgi:protein-disulfide isomerase